jgi:hypothetical protein
VNRTLTTENEIKPREVESIQDFACKFFQSNILAGFLHVTSRQIASYEGFSVLI